MKKQYKLNFEMVPEECWYANLRSVLPPAQWDRVRRDAYAPRWRAMYDLRRAGVAAGSARALELRR